jgi:hypothetical protein
VERALAREHLVQHHAEGEDVLIAAMELTLIDVEPVPYMPMKL